MADSNVFILMGCRDNEDYILGIYDTANMAREAYSKYENQFSQDSGCKLTEFEYYYIQPMIMNAPVVTLLMRPII